MQRGGRGWRLPRRPRTGPGGAGGEGGHESGRGSEQAGGDAGTGDSRTITIESVRELLQEQAGVRWERLVLRGQSCSVMRIDGRPASHPATAIARSIRPAEAGPTVRTLVEARVAQIVGASAADVRVDFGDRDQALLETPAGGRVVEIQPAGRSDRMALSVRVYQGDVIVAGGMVRVGVEIRRDVLVAREGLAHGDAITGENTAVESRWLGAAEEPADAVKAIGSVARSRLRTGDVIGEQDIQAPVVVKKGDLVNVDCLAGAVVLRRTMRSTEQARDGEVVTLAALTGKKTVRARMNGAGRAVMVVEGVPGPAGGSAGDEGAGRADSQDEGVAAGAPGREMRVGGVVVQKSSGSGRGDRVGKYSKLADGAVEVKGGAAGAGGPARGRN